MKKQVNKLKLAKETIRNLERENWELVVGVDGTTLISAPTNCNLYRQKASCEFC